VTKKFPIQDGPWIPWSVIEPWRNQADLNHSQTLERLAERGGLAAHEAVWLLEGLSWRDRKYADKDDDFFVRRLDELVREGLQAQIDELKKERDELETELASAMERLSELEERDR